MKRVVMFMAGLAALGVGTFAQGSGQSPAPAQSPTPPLATSVIAETNGIYTTIAGYISKSLAMVPDNKLTWQATPDVRSFARLFAHIADDNNAGCAATAGLNPPPARFDTGAEPNWAANKMTKAELDKALNDSIATCQKAFAALTSANMMEAAGGRGNRTKIGFLIYNTSHINEHYGNLVTYLRLNGMVPPSSGGK
jgi:uncharacterized damage-inducible protein DinB